MADPTSRRFPLVLIKPSHYDDDGYVIQWARSWIPSNSLACVYALARQAAQERLLGEDVAIELDAYDETNRIIPFDRVIRDMRTAGTGLVCLIGVQTNQFPRAVDIACRFRDAGIQVAIGGFHVSGCLAMLPDLPADIAEARDLGVTLFAGEAEEGRFAQVLRDAHAGALKPVYNHMADLPGLQGAVVPFLPKELTERYIQSIGAFDAGRGCPFQCSFCTIINVQGRKSRWRDADDVEALVRAAVAEGVTRFFITDDNFARNRNWEAIFDRLIHLREVDGLKLNFIIQVDTLCHKIEGFVEKAARAGCGRVFIGLENINPDNLAAAKKRQNRLHEYRAMLQAWREAGVITYAGYILGFPADTPEKIAHDIETIKRELPIDLLEFFCLTPLPGSEDHKRLAANGVAMDPDMNRYDLEHVCTGHPTMTAEEWQGIYDRAWDLYYTPEHVETLLKRAIASGIKPVRMMNHVLQFHGFFKYEKVHPLQGGYFRRKVRTDRRPGLPVEPAVVFYPRRAVEIVRTYGGLALYFWRLTRLRKRLKRDPSVKAYTDLAIAPIAAGDEDAYEFLAPHEAPAEATAAE